MSSIAASRSGFDDLNSLQRQRAELVKKINETQNKLKELTERQLELKACTEIAKSKAEVYAKTVAEKKALDTRLAQSQTFMANNEAQLQARLGELEKLIALSELEAENTLFALNLEGLSGPELIAEIKATDDNLLNIPAALAALNQKIELLEYNETELALALDENQSLEKEITTLKKKEQEHQSELQVLNQRLGKLAQGEKDAIRAALAKVSNKRSLDSSPVVPLAPPAAPSDSRSMRIDAGSTLPTAPLESNKKLKPVENNSNTNNAEIKLDHSPVQTINFNPDNENFIQATSIKAFHDKILENLANKILPSESDLSELRRRIDDLPVSYLSVSYNQAYTALLQYYAYRSCYLSPQLKATSFSKQAFNFFSSQPLFFGEVKMGIVTIAHVESNFIPESNFLFVAVRLNDPELLIKLYDQCCQVLSFDPKHRITALGKMLSLQNSKGKSILNAIFMQANPNFIPALEGLIGTMISQSANLANANQEIEQVIRTILNNSFSTLYGTNIGVNLDIVEQACQFARRYLGSKEAFQAYLEKTDQDGITPLGRIISRVYERMQNTNERNLLKQMAKILLDHGASLAKPLSQEDNRKLAELLPNDWQDLLQQPSLASASALLSLSTSAIATSLAGQSLSKAKPKTPDILQPTRLVPPSSSPAATSSSSSSSPLVAQEDKALFVNKIGNLAKDAFETAFKNFQDKDKLIPLVQKLAGFYTNFVISYPNIAARSNSSSSATESLALSFRNFHYKLVTTSISDPSAKLSKLFNEQVDKLIQIYPANCGQIICNLLNALSDLEICQTEAHPALALKLRVIELESWFKTPLAATIPVNQDTIALAANNTEQAKFFGTSLPKFNSIPNFNKTNITKQLHNVYKSILFVLDAAAIYKKQANQTEYKHHLQYLANFLSLFGDKLFAFADQHSSSMAMNPTLSSSSSSNLMQPSILESNTRKDLIKLYEGACFYYQRAIPLAIYGGELVKAQSFLKPLSAFVKTSLLDGTRPQHYAAMMKSHVEEYSLVSRSQSWTPEERKQLNDYIEKYQRILPNNRSMPAKSGPK